ncbi:hypothetical protein DYQ86_06665 [Acidobacteria bacterium AB60]|nr:hypothetical protein DYQ86_06665 [Acidobacteria bacterium AB60]
MRSVNARSASSSLVSLSVAFCLVVLAGSCDTGQAQSAAAPVTCATCHVGVAAHYAVAPMRHAMEPAGADPQLTAHPELRANVGKYSYRIQTSDGRSTYTVTDGVNTVTLPIRWIFGQHSQTFVLEKDGHLYESLVSFYPRDNTLAVTPGDERIVPATLTQAMGRELSLWESRSCFNCHATGVVPGHQLDPEKLAPGLDCQRCHAGAQQHMADASRNSFATLPPSLRRLDSEEISAFCGQCHRTWDTVVRNHWKGPAFVRFQPYRLGNSKCFIGNDKRISCLACHDPHQQLSHDQAYYDSKCLACHRAPHPASATSSPPASPAYKPCPVAKSNCVSCHMPKVDLPGGHQQFTDHQIRIVRPGEPYPD